MQRNQERLASGLLCTFVFNPFQAQMAKLLYFSITKAEWKQNVSDISIKFCQVGGETPTVKQAKPYK